MEKAEVRILAVDDIYDNLISIKALILESFPEAIVYFAKSGSEAIELATRLLPDVVLLDVVMPEMDGYDVCRFFKSSEILQDIPIVFITALKGDREGRIKALEVGAEAFLAKPIDESELVAQIKAMTKVRYVNKLRKTEHDQLSNIVSEKTLQLELNNVATLNLLEDLQKEVDARRKTEEKLLRSEARLRRAELAARSGNWEYNPLTKKVNLSEGAVFLLGFNTDEVDFASFLNVFSDKDRESLEKNIDKLVSENHPFNSELQVFPAGSSENIFVRLFAIKEKDEEVVFGIVRNITEHKIIREKLRESEQKYRSIFEFSPVGIIYFDQQGKIVDCNQNYVTIIGSSYEKIINTDIARFDSNAIAKCIKEALNGEVSVFEGMYNSVTAEKSTFIRATFKPISFIDIGIVGGVGIVWDLTERKRAEEIIVQSEAEFRSVWENSVNALRLSNKDGVVIRANSAFCSLFELEESEIVGKLTSDAYEKSTRGNNLYEYRHKFENNILDKNYEKLILLANGKHKWVEINKTYIETNEKQKMLLTVFNDITQRKHAEIELQSALTRNHALLTANPDIMFLFDNKYNIVDYKADTSLYKEPVDFLHKNIADVLPPDLAVDVIANISKVYETGKIVHHTYDLDIEGKLLTFEARYVHCANEVLTIVRDISATVQTQRDLVESEKKFRFLMDNSPEGITIYVDSKIVYANKEALKIIGAQKPEQILGRSLFDFIHADNIERIKKRMGFVAETPINTALPSVEEQYVKLDGTPVDVEIKVMPILYEGKAAVQISGHDITEKKHSREELERSRRELKAIYDNAPVMMCVVNENSEILFANSALSNFIETPEMLTSQTTKCGNILSCINSFENGCGMTRLCNECVLRQALVDTFKTGVEHKNIDYQTKIIKNGEEKQIALLASTSLINNDGEKRLLLCMSDITARKEAEMALYKSEMLLRTFIENIPFGVWARDLKGKAIIENSELVETFGSIMGKDVESYRDVNPDVAEKWNNANGKAYAGEVVNEEVIFDTRGKKRPFQNIVFPIKSGDEVFGIAGLTIDISERIKYQKELLDYQKLLRDFATHLQSVREEERINLAREIHDDLGQILVAIKFDIGMLGVKAKKYIRNEAVDDFKSHFNRLEQYVNNTIKSARRIMTDLRPELLDMVGLVEAFKEHINNFNERHNILCEFKNSTQFVSLPPEKSVALFRILQESLNNAAKYSEATLINVEFKSANDIFTMDIVDNGVGFDMSKKKRSDSYGLLGIRERAYLLEGKVDINSKPGEGVAIHVEVPLGPLNIT